MSRPWLLCCGLLLVGCHSAQADVITVGGQQSCGVVFTAHLTYSTAYAQTGIRLCLPTTMLLNYHNQMYNSDEWTLSFTNEQGQPISAAVAMYHVGELNSGAWLYFTNPIPGTVYRFTIHLEVPATNCLWMEGCRGDVEVQGYMADEWTVPTTYCDADHPNVEAALSTAKANPAWQGAWSGERGVVERIALEVANLTYSTTQGWADKASDVWAVRQGDCDNLTKLQCAMLRREGIPARCVLGGAVHEVMSGPWNFASTTLHAFGSYWSGDAWEDFEPMNGENFASAGIVVLGAARDFSELYPTTTDLWWGGYTTLEGQAYTSSAEWDAGSCTEVGRRGMLPFREFLTQNVWTSPRQTQEAQDLLSTGVPHVVLPNGGEAYGSNSEPLVLRWEPRGVEGTLVSAYLCRAGAPGADSLIARDVADISGYAWQVSTTTASQSEYRMKLEWTNGPYNGSNVVATDLSDGTFEIVDRVAPAPVTQLAIGGIGRTTAVLAWQAAGDDGGIGQASQTRLVYSQQAVTESNFDQCSTVPTGGPEPAGLLECAATPWATLQPCTRYYFALKTCDEEGNWSALSNVVSGTTLCSGYQEVLCGGDGLFVESGSGGGWLLEGSVLDEDAEDSAAAVADAVSSEAEVPTVRVYAPKEVSSAADLLARAAVEADTCGLRVPAATDSGQLALRLSSKSDATWTLSGVKLLGVDHAVEERVVLAGELALVGTLHALDAVTDSSGSDLAAALASGQEAVTVQVGGTWDLSVSGVDAGGAALFLEVVGRGAEDGDDTRGITVLAEDGTGGWRALTTLVPRDGENRLVVDSLPGDHLRLLIHDECTVERLAWLGSCRRVSPQELGLVRAELSEVGSVLPADDGEADLDVTIGPGENLVLTYDVPALRPDQARDFFLVARGRQEESERPAVALSTAAATPRPMALPAAFALQQNQPNPFSGTTTVRFDLPVASKVDVSIFDLQGRRVRTLASGDFAAGFQSAIWDHRDDAGNSMRPGIYLCQLAAGTFRTQRTMVLLP